jgi:hypothetical protein
MLDRNRVAASLAIILINIVMPRVAGSATSAVASSLGCLPAGNGYLRARIRGALNLDIDWRNGELECQGEARPDGSGIRMSFAGPPRADGHRLRLVFGVRAHEGGGGRALPTNLTVILEGERRLFSTQGDDKCTVDRLRQEPFGDARAARDYRVIARGFCTAPATALSGSERIVVSSFDFAGRISYSGPPAAHPGAHS